MKVFVLLAFVAVTSAISRDFSPTWSKTLLDQQVQRQLIDNQVRRSRGNLIGIARYGVDEFQQETGKQTIAQALCDRVVELIENIQRENVDDDTVQGTSDRIRRLILQAKQAKITESIDKLQNQQWKSQLGGRLQETKTVAVVKAVELLRKQLQKTEQEKGAIENTSFEELKKTLQVVIQAELITEKERSSFGGVSQPAPTLSLAKIQKLIIQFCISDIQKENADLQQLIQQLQQQQQLVREQRRLIQSQIVVLKLRGGIETAQRLEGVKIDLGRKEQDLVEKQVACSLIAEQLQEAATENELQLQKQTVIEQEVENQSLTGGSGRREFM